MRTPHCMDFPAFGRGLSLRLRYSKSRRTFDCHFPAFGRGLSLRLNNLRTITITSALFPRLRAGTFIEAGTGYC